MAKKYLKTGRKNTHFTVLKILLMYEKFVKRNKT